MAWRDEVSIMTGELRNQFAPEDLLEDFPLKPQELLRDRSDRVFKHLVRIKARHAEAPVWLLDNNGTVETLTMEELAGKEKDYIGFKTVILAPQIGGLRDGLLDGNSETADDVADNWLDDSGNPRRIRVWNDDPQFDEKINGKRLIRRIDVNPDADEAESEEEGPNHRYWCWYEVPRLADDEGSKVGSQSVLWEVHRDDVVREATKIGERLQLPEELRNAVILAAKFHDLGKRRREFQRILGNMNSDILLAKTRLRKQPHYLNESFRHEFASLLDAQKESEFQNLSDDMKDVMLHLIASHHGCARPHFPTEEAFDTESNERTLSQTAMQVPQRFARLQRKYGRWGLAYLESLLRAADYAASACPSKTVEDER